MVAAMAGGTNQVAGDPARSAAAERQRRSVVANNGSAAIATLARAGISTKEQQKLDTARAALGIARQTGDTRLRDRAQRQVAGVMHKSLRTESRDLARAASSARLAGFSDVASDLQERADRKKHQAKQARRVARHGVVSAQRRASPMVRLLRERYRDALSDVGGEHDLLRADINRQIEMDEQQAQVLPSKIAMNRAVAEERSARYQSKGNTRRAALAQRVGDQRDRRLREEQTVLQQRLVENRALATQLTPREGETVAQATRRVARVRAVDAHQRDFPRMPLQAEKMNTKLRSTSPRDVRFEERAEAQQFTARLQHLARQKPTQRPSVVAQPKRSQSGGVPARARHRPLPRGDGDAVSTDALTSRRRVPHTVIDDLRTRRQYTAREGNIAQIRERKARPTTEEEPS